MLLLHADLRIAASASASAAAASCYFYPTRDLRRGRNLAAASGPVLLHSISTTSRASSSYHRPIQASVSGSKEIKKPPICTADELHYVPVPGTEWRLALWRYLPSPEAPKRNHPLMLLSGVGTNAIGYDLSPGASFTRHMSSQGFDTWVVEVRGAGLSMRTVDSKAIEQFIDKPYLDSSDEDNFSSLLTGQQQSVVNSAPVPNTKITANRNKKEIFPLDESQLVMKLSATFLRLAERLSGYLNEGQLKAISSKFFDRIAKLLEDARLSERFDEIRASILGLLEARQNSAVAGQLRELSQRLVNVIEEGQRSVSPQLFDLQERLSATIEDFQSQLDLIIIYDWDFDNYLEEDVPAAMQYIRQQSMSSDGKLLAIGHSMGGILLYAMLARYS